jgi:hypothetical protein
MLLTRSEAMPTQYGLRRIWKMHIEQNSPATVTKTVVQHSFKCSFCRERRIGVSADMSGSQGLKLGVLH